MSLPFSHRTVTGWCSSSSSWAGLCTETRPCPNAPFSNSYDRWTSGRRSTTEAKDALWSTVCKFPQPFRVQEKLESMLALKMKHLHLLSVNTYCNKSPKFLCLLAALLLTPALLDKQNICVSYLKLCFSSRMLCLYITTAGTEVAAAGHSVPSALCVKCFSTSALWMFSTLSKH